MNAAPAAQACGLQATGYDVGPTPARRSKRLVVLERLAQEFEIGIRYPEAEVRVILERFHPDHAALRRYLVDEGFLGREQGVYWRTGGRVDV